MATPLTWRQVNVNLNPNQAYAGASAGFKSAADIFAGLNKQLTDEDIADQDEAFRQEQLGLSRDKLLEDQRSTDLLNARELSKIAYNKDKDKKVEDRNFYLQTVGDNFQLDFGEEGNALIEQTIKDKGLNAQDAQRYRSDLGKSVAPEFAVAQYGNYLKSLNLNPKEETEALNTYKLQNYSDYFTSTGARASSTSGSGSGKVPVQTGIRAEINDRIKNLSETKQATETEIKETQDPKNIRSYLGNIGIEDTKNINKFIDVFSKLKNQYPNMLPKDLISSLGTGDISSKLNPFTTTRGIVSLDDVIQDGKFNEELIQSAITKSQARTSQLAEYDKEPLRDKEGNVTGTTGTLTRASAARVALDAEANALKFGNLTTPKEKKAWLKQSYPYDTVKSFNENWFGTAESKKDITVAGNGKPKQNTATTTKAVKSAVAEIEDTAKDSKPTPLKYQSMLDAIDTGLAKIKTEKDTSAVKNTILDTVRKEYTAKGKGIPTEVLDRLNEGEMEKGVNKGKILNSDGSVTPVSIYRKLTSNKENIRNKMNENTRKREERGDTQATKNAKRLAGDFAESSYDNVVAPILGAVTDIPDNVADIYKLLTNHTPTGKY